MIGLESLFEHAAAAALLVAVGFLLYVFFTFVIGFINDKIE
jgi:hypothetical protein